VLAIDVTPDMQPDPALNHTLEIFLRSVRITNFAQAQAALTRADFALRPVLSSVQWSDFDRLAELIALGEACARTKMLEIQRAYAQLESPQGRPPEIIQTTERAQRNFSAREFIYIGLPPGSGG
jgi:predicted acylesterase/phospholipase RssA